MVAKSLATGEPVISPDQVQDMINRMGGQAGPVKAPQVPPKKSDQLFISDQPRFISEERPLLKPIRKPVDPGRRFNDLQNIIEPRDTNIMPKNRADLIPVIRPGTGFIGGPPIPQAPTITPPRKPMSVGGIGGMGGRINRMMVR